ncbi:MAG: cell division protein ZapE, partial [Paracoccaceae bacterium]
AAGALRDDLAQRAAIGKLQLLHNRLIGYDPGRPKRVGLGLFGWGREKLRDADVPGLYLFGPVGRGKSMLMDMFFAAAPVVRKRRVHFHAFMQEIHAGLHAARRTGVDDAIAPVARDVARASTLLCFDEMQIADITDAMIVGRLFEALLSRGVIIVTTSNRHPDELYRDGLNRGLFLPFIDLIKARLDIHHLESPTDHRLARLRGVRVYHTPLGQRSREALDDAFGLLTGREAPGPLTISANGREFDLPRFRAGVARASFAELCSRPLGPADYLALAASVRVLVLDGVPRLSPERKDEAKRFATLVDALYEARVRLICSAEAEPDDLYPKGKWSFEFARTASRLHEMRSRDWTEGEADAG